MTRWTESQRVRMRQWLALAGVVCGLLLAAMVGVALTGTEKPAPRAKEAIGKRSYIAPGESVAPEDAWRGVSDTRLTTIEQRLKSLESDNREAERKVPAATKGASSPERISAAELDARLRDYERKVAQEYPPGKPSDTVATGASAAPSSTDASGSMQTGGKSQPAASMARTSAIDKQPAGIVTIKLRTVDSRVGAQTSGQAPNAAGETRQSVDGYLPAGMFGQVVLLSGLDAPTGGQAQNDPHPVLMEMVDLARLPNRYRYNWKHCHLIGAGYGDLSSERAMIRTETLSCVAADGRVLDVPVKGFVVGEDGKAGMRGRLISKQGQVLANALLAGVASGIGAGMEGAANLRSVSPLGSTSTVKPGEEFQAAIGTGVGRSLDKLANYYISLAEKMFPVIEIDASRTADVILTEGVSTNVQLSD